MQAMIPLQMASAAMTVIGQVKAGKAASRAAKARAARHEQKAKIERAKAQREAKAQRRQARLAQSRLLARSAAQGGAADASSKTALARLAGDGELNALNAMASGELSAVGSEFDAGMARFDGKTKKQAAYRGALGEGLSYAAKFAPTVDKWLT